MNNSAAGNPASTHRPPQGDGHHNQGLVLNLVVASVLCPAFATIFVLLRFYTCRAIIKRIHTDDWLILTGLLLFVCYAVLQIVELRFGLGGHLLSRTSAAYQIFGKLSASSSVTYNVSTLFIKSSILTFYLRFTTSRVLRAVIYVVMSIAIGYSLAGAFGFLYLCTPVQTYWGGSPGTCLDIDTWFLACSALNVFTDVLILLLPIWILRPLRMGFIQKAAVTCILMAGGFVLGISVIRLLLIISGERQDFDVRLAVNVIWCLVELSVGFICACLPYLKALLTRAWPRIFDIGPSERELKLNTIRISTRPDRYSMVPVFNREVKYSILEEKDETASQVLLLRQPSMATFRTVKYTDAPCRWCGRCEGDDAPLPEGWIRV